MASISVSPTNASVGDTVTITWYLKPTCAPQNLIVRMLWASGTQDRTVNAKNTSGSFSVVVPSAGDTTIKLKCGGTTKASTVLHSASALVGWGRNTTGGAGGTVYDVTDFAGFRAALEASGPRIIRKHGSANFDGNGANFNVTNGNITVDGSDWTGSMKDYSIVWRCSNLIFTELAWRTGEGDTPTLSTDRRAITFNPPTGGSIRNVVLNKCSFAWGPDVVASWLNDVADVTAQYCIFGPALLGSNIPTSENGYGPNITDSTGGVGNVARFTYFRNLHIMNNQRNIRAFTAENWEVINCAVYDWGQDSGHGNPTHGSLLGNMFKKGPETLNERGWRSELGGANSQTYNLNSIYFPVPGDTADPSHVNIGINRTGGGTFPLSRTFASGTKRTTPYGTAPTNANLATPSEALFAQVVAAAGRTYQDPVDTLIKAHALAGTSDGFYNGAGFPAPHPSW